MSDNYYDARDDRLRRYPGARGLDQSRRIVIRVSDSYAQTYAGQVALLVAANLFARMSQFVALDIPAVTMVQSLPWAGQDLAAFALAQMQASDPRGDFHLRPATADDYVVHLGASGGHMVIHGSGWLAYIGPGPSPLLPVLQPNPVGPALAVILAAARVFVHGFDSPAVTLGFNAFNWTHEIAGAGAPPELSCNLDLGEVWTVGAGSVGTAILYFLTLLTRDFSGIIFDGDRVKRENITRSPIFVEADVTRQKAAVTAGYLKGCGVETIVPEAVALHESHSWDEREAGTPDLLIAAANEHNVRHVIESLFPPVQIYGTTGRNWQASMIRHIPMHDPCSCCVFRETTFAPTECATDSTASQDPQVDASLPFLSFAAGLMAAAEIFKLQLPGYASAANRAYLCTRPEPRFVVARTAYRDDCLCRRRSSSVHGQMIDGSRHAGLSG